MRKKSFLYYDIILASFASMLLISNLAATKLIAFGPIITDGGAFLFPLIYIFGDILTEVYGYKYARRAIWMAFAVMLLGVVSFTIVRYLPAAADYTAQASYEAVLGFFPRIVLASLAAYLIGSFINSYLLARLKARMNGKHLWVRLIGSTFVGQFFDTLIFAVVAFGGILGFGDMVVFILVGWLFKTSVEIVLLPISYKVINTLKKRENIDANDRDTDFTPFKLGV